MPKKPMVIAMVSNKGGVGKTTTTAALGYLLSKKADTRVLIIDADPQCNCARKFGAEPDTGIGGLGQMILDYMQQQVKPQPLDNYLFKNKDYPQIDVLFGGKSLKTNVYDFIFLKDSMNASYVFRDIIDDITKAELYDYILIDTAPTFGNEINAILGATQYVLSPILANTDSVEGTNTTMSFLGPVRKRLNPELKVLGVFFNQTRDRTRALHQLEPIIRQGWGDAVMKTRIPYNGAAVDESINEGEPVTKRKPNSKASKAFEALLEEVLERAN